MFDHTGQQIVWWQKLRERLATNKQRSHRLHMERFNLKKFNSIWNKEELPDQWNESITVPIHKKG
jgi:hypothetical protein